MNNRAISGDLGEDITYVQQKKELLEKLYLIAKKQYAIINVAEVDDEKLQRIVNDKQEIIEQINELDNKIINKKEQDEISGLLKQIQSLDNKLFPMLEKHSVDIKNKLNKLSQRKNVNMRYKDSMYTLYDTTAVFYDSKN